MMMRVDNRTVLATTLLSWSWSYLPLPQYWHILARGCDSTNSGQRTQFIKQLNAPLVPFNPHQLSIETLSTTQVTVKA